MASKNLARQPLGPFLGGAREDKEPYLIDPMELSKAVNVVFDRFAGKIGKRPGTIKISSITGITKSPTQAYAFTNAEGTEILLATDAGNRQVAAKVVYTADLITWTTLKKYDGTDLTWNKDVFLSFAVAENKCWIGNGIEYIVSFTGLTTAGVLHDSSPEYVCGAGGITWTSTTFNPALVAAYDKIYDGKILMVTARTADGPQPGEESRLTWVSHAVGYTLDTPLSDEPVNGTSKCKIGVEIPHGAYLKYGYGILWVARTPENLSECRFQDTLDADNPIYEVSLDNPKAWPATHQLEIGSEDGDSIWGFTPTFNNRFGVMKTTSIYRIDPDPTTLFTFEIINSVVGSRYPFSWIAFEDRIFFIGSDSSYKHDIFTTDLNSVESYKRKNKTTLDSIKQFLQTIRTISVNTATMFNLGTLGGYCDISANLLDDKDITSQAEWETYADHYLADTKSHQGSVTIRGVPRWDVQYHVGTYTGGASNPNDILTAAVPPWAKGSGSCSLRVASGKLFFEFQDGSGSWTNYYRSVSSGKNLLATSDLHNSSANGRMDLRLYNGVARAILKLQNNQTLPAMTYAYMNDNLITSYPCGEEPIWHVLLDVNNQIRVYKNGLAIYTAAGVDDITAAKIEILVSPNNTEYSWLRHLNFCDSFGYLASEMPTTIPTTGYITMRKDWMRTPWTNIDNWFGAHYTVKAVQDGGSANVLLYTRSSADLASWSSWQYCADGTVPINAKRRYIDEKCLLTRNSLLYGPELQSMVGGCLYVSHPIYISDDISAWRYFLQSVSGTVQMFIRRSEEDINYDWDTLNPKGFAETGWKLTGGDTEGWFAINNGENIGTILGEADPPLARWIQLCWMGMPTTGPARPNVSSYSASWLEGPLVNCPVAAVNYDGNYIASCITGDSKFTNLIMLTDKNGAMANWLNLPLAFMIWFKGQLYGLKTNDAQDMKDVVEIKTDELADEGAAIDAYVETQDTALSDIAARKVLRTVDLSAEEKSATIEVGYKREGETSFTSLASPVFSATEGVKRLNFPMGKQCRRVIIKLRNAADREDLAIRTLAIGYTLKPTASGK